MFDFNDILNDKEYIEEMTELINSQKTQINQSIIDTDKYLLDHKNSLSKQDIIKIKQLTLNMVNKLIQEINEDVLGEPLQIEKDFIVFLQDSKSKIEDLFNKYL